MNIPTYNDFLASHIAAGIPADIAELWAAADVRAEARSEWFANDLAYRNGTNTPK